MTAEEIKKKEHYAKIRKTILERHGADFYSKIGKRGGTNSPQRTFNDPEIARKAAGKSLDARRKKALNKK